MKHLYIARTNNADSRTADSGVNKELLLENSKLHIQDVQIAMKYFVDIMTEQAKSHDWTKVDYIDDFYNDFTKYKDQEFKDATWFPKHITEERHHLTDHVPDDVNFIDVFERICDICMAGMARSGNVYADALPDDLLQTAYKNTINMLKERIIVIDDICPKFSNYMFKVHIVKVCNYSVHLKSDEDVECFLDMLFLYNCSWTNEIKSELKLKYTNESIRAAYIEIKALFVGGG